MTFSEEEITKILNQYKKKRDRENKYYHETTKNKEEFVLKNRARAKAHYDLNKDKKKEKYNENKDFIKAKNLYRYYVKKEKVDSFKEKHEDKFNLLKERNVIQ